MPLSNIQIQEIKKRAKARGISELDISNALARLNQASVRTSLGQGATTGQTQGVQTFARQPQAQVSGGGGVQVSQPQEGSFVGNFFRNVFKAAVEPAKQFGRFAGEALYQGGKFLTQPAFRKSVMGGELTGEEAKQILSKPQTRFLKPSQVETPGAVAKAGVKAYAGAASYLVPGGQTVKAGLALGALSGALYGLSEGEDINVDDIIFGSIGGAIGGAITPLVGKAVGAGKKAIQKIGKGGRKLTGLTEEAAAISINKATPSMWDKALKQHGFDLNNITKKYWKKGVGYDDMLGPIAERGKGGIFKEILDTAEDAITKEMGDVSGNTILPIDDFIKELTNQKKLLSKIPGNKPNIKALTEFIKGLKAKYGRGITPKQLLTIKRATDSRFGAAVAKETAGGPVAQAQKMLANAARAKLKSLFPKVADALDTQSEVLTLRPIINRARSIANTRGSEIRLGKLTNVNLTDLLQPQKWGKIGEVVLADPKRASQLLEQATDEVVEEGMRKLPIDLAGLAGRTLGAGGTISAAKPSEKQVQTQTEQQISKGKPKGQFQQQLPDHAGMVTQTMPESQPRPFGGKSKQELLLLALSQGAGKSDLEEIAGIYDMISAETPQVSEEVMNIANDLRTEYFKRTQENNFLDISNAYNKVLATTNTPAGDIALIFAYMKMLDPGSVVREGEFATAENTAGVPQQIRKTYNKILKGKRLSDEQRQGYIQEATAIYSQYQQSQSSIDNLYQNLAQQYGISPNLVGIGIYNQ